LSLTLLLGGARSGKSSLAVELAQHDADVVFVATAEPFDDDLRDRVARHRADRPPWPTVEAPVELADAVRSAPPEATVIVDCLTVWVGNLFHHRPDTGTRAAAYGELRGALTSRSTATIVVSNEVGMGLHPDSELGREYRDELGRLNQMVAAVADTTLLMVAGRALRLHDPKELV
jgi:adenosylcobinamide kinase / adenosylcobinamide-phosphate guanylyltransferase